MYDIQKEVSICAPVPTPSPPRVKLATARHNSSVRYSMLQLPSQWKSTLSSIYIHLGESVVSPFLLSHSHSYSLTLSLSHNNPPEFLFPYVRAYVRTGFPHRDNARGVKILPRELKRREEKIVLKKGRGGGMYVKDEGGKKRKQWGVFVSVGRSGFYVAI